MHPFLKFILLLFFFIITYFILARVTVTNCIDSPQDDSGTLFCLLFAPDRLLTARLANQKTGKTKAVKAKEKKPESKARDKFYENKPQSLIVAMYSLVFILGLFNI